MPHHPLQRELEDYEETDAKETTKPLSNYQPKTVTSSDEEKNGIKQEPLESLVDTWHTHACTESWLQGGMGSSLQPNKYILLITFISADIHGTCTL